VLATNYYNNNKLLETRVFKIVATTLNLLLSPLKTLNFALFKSQKAFVLNPSSNPNSDRQKIPISNTKNNFVSPKNELTWGKKSIFFEFVGPQVQKMNSP
jgi:hypothetical protein